jgi:hypothetical protein
VLPIIYGWMMRDEPPSSSEDVADESRAAE